MIVDPKTGKAQFNPIWLKWFLDFAQILSSIGAASGSAQHNSLGGLQGGQGGQYFHLTQAEFTALVALSGIAGLSATITTAKLTVGGTFGSMTFQSGLLTAQTAAT